MPLFDRAIAHLVPVLIIFKGLQTARHNTTVKNPFESPRSDISPGFAVGWCVEIGPTKTAGCATLHLE